ncbi:hypothetical protein L208DRAFT_1405449 [Tricholoma matsutake]|nr:hypothetical protein L208DRAFT_1405449 [Tricholoma matsutake 945]
MPSSSFRDGVISPLIRDASANSHRSSIRFTIYDRGLPYRKAWHKRVRTFRNKIRKSKHVPSGLRMTSLASSYFMDA